jgi:hypothetical protein
MKGYSTSEQLLHVFLAAGLSLSLFTAQTKAEEEDEPGYSMSFNPSSLFTKSTGL